MSADRSKTLSVTHEDIIQASARVAKVLSPTPLTHTPIFSEQLGREIYLKWDNKLRTGSFKERGAVNVLTLLKEKKELRGVCAASAGNHALALSFHAAKFKIPCTIVMPTTAPLVKVQSTVNTGAEVILFGTTFDDAYEQALALSKERGLEFISAFDDERIIAGQGTAGLEILEQCPDVDTVVVPVGGGGLIAGIAIALKALKPSVHVLGAQSEWAASARADSKNSTPTLLPPATIADGIAVKRIGKVTRPIIDATVDQLVNLSEAEIARGIVRLLEYERTVVEGAGAAGVAAALAGHLPAKSKKIAIMVCGSNIDMNVLSRLIERDMGEKGRLLKCEVSVPDRPGSLHATTSVISKSGANILQVLHDRSFSRVPGNVDITFELEVKNKEHKAALLEQLRTLGILVREL